MKGEGSDSISVDLTFTLHPELIRGAAIFAVLQLIVLYSLFLSTRSVERERNAGMVSLGQFAAQVAHDIRSPLLALNMVSNHVDTLGPEIRGLLTGAIERIRAISESLLAEYRHVSTSGLRSTTGGRQVLVESFDANALIAQLLEEKKSEFKHRQGLSWELISDDKVELKIPRLAFLRVMSNLLNNAAEGVDVEGSVQVTIRRNSKKFLIKIADTGKGIPTEVLKKIGKERVTFGKENGNGLGLSYVFDQASHWGAMVKVNSSLGRGTVVILEIPESAKKE